jgi:hypothetical protein
MDRDEKILVVACFGRRQEKSPARPLRRAGLKSIQEGRPQQSKGVIAAKYRPLAQAEQPSFGGGQTDIGAFSATLTASAADLKPRHVAYAYSTGGLIEPCLPTKADSLPSGGLWVHEIKHDGFGLLPARMGRG